MKLPAIRPRPDQISLLTLGLELPLPAIEADHLEIIADGLLRAFNDVRTLFPAVVASGGETEVTALMESQLNILIQQDLSWGNLVQSVAKGKESVSFDGSHLEERPDLSLNLTRRDLRFPLVVEAKIFDAACGKTRNLYCEQGLRRFLEGKYAWGTREAFMSAYVRDGLSITATLNPFLSGTVADGTPGYLVEEFRLRKVYLPSIWLVPGMGGPSSIPIKPHHRARPDQSHFGICGFHEPLWYLKRRSPHARRWAKVSDLAIGIARFARFGEAHICISLCRGREAPPERAAALMRPGADPPELEIIRVRLLRHGARMRLEHAVGDAVPLRVGDGLLLGVEAQLHLRQHVVRAGPAHQRLGLARGGGLVVQEPVLGLGLARLHGGFWQACRCVRTWCPGCAKQSSQKWPSRFCDKTPRKQITLSRHSLAGQGRLA